MITHKIEALRRRAGLTQAQLAELVGTSVSQVCRWERGRVTPSVESALQLAKALKVSIDELLDQPAA